ncbi:MAG: hypothetical protein JNL59_03925 [Chitinophagaceae bacterium]|jgi:hypothetical protein|nr:hypothetical protein [Chitinophagaceae bacterium]
MKPNRILLAFSLFVMATGIKAQNEEKKGVFTEEALSSGNYKDVFRSFFQLAFNQLTSEKKEFAFTTNPYAIMVKMNEDKLKTEEYLKYTWLRRFNISFAGKLNEENRFNGFTSGIKYAIINQRDETVSRLFLQQALNASAERTSLNQALSAYIQSFSGDGALQANNEVNSIMNGDAKFKDLSPSLQSKLKELAGSGNFNNLKKLIDKSNDFNLKQVAIDDYNAIKTNFQKRWLVTLGVSDTTYTDKFRFSTVVLSAEILKGISNPGKKVDVELSINGGYNFVNDTLKAGRDLDRRALQVESGFNFIFNDGAVSWAELKVSGEYNRVFKGLYTDERKDLLTVNGTLRLRLFRDLWLPIEIKYDPKEGRVFGFLDVRFNFTALSRK